MNTHWLASMGIMSRPPTQKRRVPTAAGRPSGTIPDRKGIMTTTTTTKTRTITLTGRPPAKIREAEWPILASAEGDS